MCIKIHYYIWTFHFYYPASLRGASLKTNTKYTKISPWLSNNYKTVEVMESSRKGIWLNKPEAYFESIKGKVVKMKTHSTTFHYLSVWWPLVLLCTAGGGGIGRDVQLGLGASNLLFLSWYACMKFSKEKNPPNKINNNTSKDTRPWWFHLFPQVLWCTNICDRAREADTWTPQCPWLIAPCSWYWVESSSAQSM